MNARERWQALQTRLTAAQAFEAAGDRRSALREVDAALELDPNFLAAHALRERLVSGAPIQTPALNAPLPSEQTNEASRGVGYAMFEQRARRRRVDRKVEAARTAIEARRLREAASALDEVIELDPNLPELASLTAQFDDLRRGRTDRHRGPLFVAAASFAVVMLGATWLEHAHPNLAARPTTNVAELVEATPPVRLTTPEPSATDTIEPAETIAPAAAAAPVPASTIGVRNTAAITPPELVREPAPRPAEPRSEPAVVRSIDVTPEPRMPAAPVVSDATMTVGTAGTPAPPPAPAPAATRPPDPQIIPPVLQPAPSAAALPAAVVRTPNDEQLVRQALQRYRTAYEGLDAPSARAVYPAVNEAALARAFDGLASQTITFDACDVQMRGDIASATCRGSARYVPKIGSREPRTEPRTWTFSLRRAGVDWEIENARANR